MISRMFHQNNGEQTKMMMTITQASLVVLAGIYAMRFGAGFFGQGFAPLSFLALFAFCMSIVFFYRWPTVPGWWLYTSMALFLLGIVVNSMFLIAPDALHSSPVAITFSVVSVAGWSILFIQLGLQLLGRAA
jgi:hypothetical protein